MIYGSYYKEEPLFYGETVSLDPEPGIRYYGVELELENEYEDFDEVESFATHVESNIPEELSGFFYFKTDPTVYCGVEVVTHPATITTHLKAFSYLLDAAMAYDMVENDGCGLHIHFGRNVLQDSFYKIGGLIGLVSHFWRYLRFISDRNDDDVSRFCYEPFLEDNFLDTYATTARDRYNAVNVRNDETVEYRLPASTTGLRRLIGHIEILDALIDIADSFNDRYNDMEQLEAVSVSDVLNILKLKPCGAGYWLFKLAKDALN